MKAINHVALLLIALLGISLYALFSHFAIDILKSIGVINEYAKYIIIILSVILVLLIIGWDFKKVLNSIGVK